MADGRSNKSDQGGVSKIKGKEDSEREYGRCGARDGRSVIPPGTPRMLARESAPGAASE